MGSAVAKEYSHEFNTNEWKRILDILLSNSELRQHALAKSKHDIYDLNELIDHFEQFETKISNEKLFKEGKLAKAWLVYLWITHNIEYSSNPNDIDEFDSESTGFKFKKFNCEGFTSLFEYICNQLSVECIQIIGFTKGFTYQISDSFGRENHAWNAIKLGVHWYLVDTTWGAGHKNEVEFVYNFNPYWFLTPAQLFIYTHFSPVHQFQKEKLTLDKFQQLPLFHLNFYLLNLKCLSHDTFQISSSSAQVFIEFSAPEHVLLTGELHEKLGQNFSDKLINTVFLQRDAKTHNYCLLVLVPEKNKLYKLCLYAANKTKGKSYEGVATFLIKREDDELIESIPKYSLIFPNNVKCLSHRAILINSTSETLFIEFATPKNLFFKAALRENLFGKKSNKIEDCLFIQRDSKSSKYGLFVLLPHVDLDYRLNIYVSDTNELFTEIGNFILKRTGPKTLFTIPKYALEFSYGIKCLSHHSSIIKVKESPLFIEFTVPSKIDFDAKLVHFNSSSDELSKQLLIQKDSKTLKHAIIVLMPEVNRNFKLIIYANESNSENTLYEIGSFLLRAKHLKVRKKLPKYSLEYDYNFKCVSHRSSLIESKKNPIDLFFSAPQTTLLTAKLKDDRNNEIEHATLVQRTLDQNYFEIKVILPEKEYYYNLIIYATHKNDADKPYKQAAEFKLTTLHSGLGNKRFLKTYNKDLESYIFSPIEYNLKLNVVYNFRFYLKDAIQVAIVTQIEEKIDWFYFKSSSNHIWSLSKSFDLIGEIKLLVKTASSGNSYEWLCSYMICK